MNNKEKKAPLSVKRISLKEILAMPDLTPSERFIARINVPEKGITEDEFKKLFQKEE